MEGAAHAARLGPQGPHLLRDAGACVAAWAEGAVRAAAQFACALHCRTASRAPLLLRFEAHVVMPFRVSASAQAGTRPPSFVFFVNDEKLFTDDYRRYMERQLRDNIGEGAARTGGH